MRKFIYTNPENGVGVLAGLPQEEPLPDGMAQEVLSMVDTEPGVNSISMDELQASAAIYCLQSR